MTYKEMLQKSLEPYMTERIEFDDLVSGRHEVQEPKECLSICFAQFVSNLGSILIWVADMLLAETVPDLYNGDEKVETGKARPKPIALDYMRVLTGHDFTRGIMLSLQLQPFIEWLLKQEAPEGDFENMWYDAEVLSDKWNEFAKERNNET